MAWVKLDDAFLDHPKFVVAGPLAGYLAVTAIAWSNRNLTDGYIPKAQVPRLVNFAGIATVNGHRGNDVEPKALGEELVAVGLWEQVEGGFLIHDFHDYQPSAEAVRAARHKDRKRKQQGFQTESERNPDGI